jgi:Holliday junction DNA helicase RuvA
MIEVQGVGYDLEASLSTFANLPELGVEVTLYTHLSVREDAHTLYGFASVAERSLFRNLIRISGIGAKLALLILSGMNVETFASCVREGDTLALTRLPGIGKKTAERLIIEMRDRIAEIDLINPAIAGTVKNPMSPLTSSPTDDAVRALVALGYKSTDALQMVRALDTEDLPSEEIIRRALQMSVSR